MAPHQDPPPAGDAQPPADSANTPDGRRPVDSPAAQQPGQQPPWPWQEPGQSSGWQAPGQPPGKAQAGAPYVPPGTSPYGQLPAAPPYGAPPSGPRPGAPQYGPPVGQVPYGGPPPYGQPPVPYPPPQYGPPPYGQPYGGYPQQWAMKEPSTATAPPGTPYHRLARTPRHRWWRPIIGTVVLVVGAFFTMLGVVLVWELAHALVTGEFAEPAAVDKLFDNPTEDLAVNLVILGILTPVVLFTVRWIQRRPALSVASVLNRIRWRWMLLCCLPGVGYLALNYGLGAAFEALFPGVGDGTDPADDGSFVGWARFVVPALVILLLVPFQSAAEEFVFRGWLVQAIGSYGPDDTDGNAVVQAIKRLFRTPWPALVISSIAFVFSHGYTGWAMADIFLFAIVIGWLTIRTGGLECGIALHSVNNIVAFMIPAAVGQLGGWADQGGAPWPVFVLDLPCMALYAVAVLRLAKRQKIAEVS
ncbi:CPBP family intramembrane glutamic endopeptidase [Kribbella sp. CA-293567]|uniref:CPBP family intramembrane glutamic endopeptidase n=1 Tax=Kribbella sp. CA-293567 TaxID=3002436 RepID=UPI0022DE290A|nr:type II CAAX endopeptidase family protein [Kribbella sp. CA-293567]WBQ02061.1 type II CAAX endopeptidase family protein [Kribbella sp. CA-293567]